MQSGFYCSAGVHLWSRRIGSYADSMCLLDLAQISVEKASIEEQACARTEEVDATYESVDRRVALRQGLGRGGRSATSSRHQHACHTRRQRPQPRSIRRLPRPSSHLHGRPRARRTKPHLEDGRAARRTSRGGRRIPDLPKEAHSKSALVSADLIAKRSFRVERGSPRPMSTESPSYRSRAIKYQVTDATAGATRRRRECASTP